MSTEPKDCRFINGDQAVIISRSTAREALDAMKKLSHIGAYAYISAEDKSFVAAVIRELENAVAK